VLLRRSELLTGARLGQHEIVRLLGQGATASVFEGRHVKLGKPVAVKVLHEHLAADAQTSGRFVREGQVAAQLRHPNAVDVIDVGVEAGTPYLVMELLHGQDLQHLLRERGALPVDEALAILLPIASALAQAHAQGILHRDVKPANIFLAEDLRGDVVPKLVDFGLSKLVDDASPPLTETNMVVGTMQYIAPEQTQGSKYSSAKSDQYSFAAILYECTTGQSAFHGEGFYELLDAIRTGFVKPPSLVDPRIPPAFDDVVMRAMSRDPARRWADMRELSRALLPFAAEPTSAAWRRIFADDAKSSGSTVAASGSRVRAPASASAATLSSEKIAPLPCAPGTSPFHIKGNPYRGLVHFVERAIPGGMDRFCDALDDARLRDFVRQPFLASGRYDVLPFVPLSAALAKLVGVSFDQFVRTATTGQVRYDARTIFHLIFAGATMEDLPARFVRFGSQYYDYGEHRGWHEGPRRVVLLHAGIPKYLHRWFGPMQLAYAEETARIVGAENVVGVTRPAVPAGERYRFELVDAATELTWG